MKRFLTVYTTYIHVLSICLAFCMQRHHERLGHFILVLVCVVLVHRWYVDYAGMSHEGRERRLEEIGLERPC